jgi:hypothetical protein
VQQILRGGVCAVIIVEHGKERLIRFGLERHSKWQASKHKTSQCLIFSDFSVGSIRWLQTYS